MHHQMTTSSSKEASMTGKVLIVLTVLAVDISTCFGQYGEMGAAMEGMMGGGMGGLGAMMGGGGMGGYGAMMGGGEMGGYGAMMGGGTGGGIGAAIGAMVRQGAMTSAMNRIKEALHYIVGPEAKPDKQLTDYTMSQRGPPQTLQERMAYLAHMKRIARNTYGSWLAEQSTGTAGKSLAQLQADLDTIVMQRAMEYGNRPKPQRSAAGGGTMAAIGAMLPTMIQGIQAQYM